jgi:hypothetical protein
MAHDKSNTCQTHGMAHDKSITCGKTHCVTTRERSETRQPPCRLDRQVGDKQRWDHTVRHMVVHMVGQTDDKQRWDHALEIDAAVLKFRAVWSGAVRDDGGVESLQA